MIVGILAIGDELLSGQIQESNSMWLANELSNRGVVVGQISVVPDSRTRISAEIDRFTAEFDAVITTGGLGTTPDDVTVAAVADAFNRKLTVNETARRDVIESLQVLRSRLPDIDVDVDREATLPADVRYLENPVGLSPGFVLGRVYALPGIPAEMQQMFEQIASEFQGPKKSRSFYTDSPESNYTGLLSEIQERYDVSVGSYPDRAIGANQIRVTAAETDQLEAAYDALRDRLETVTPAASPDYTPRGP